MGNTARCGVIYDWNTLDVNQIGGTVWLQDIVPRMCNVVMQRAALEEPRHRPRDHRNRHADH